MYSIERGEGGGGFDLQKVSLVSCCLMLYLNGLENFFLSSGSEEFVNTWYRVPFLAGSSAGWLI